VAGRPAVVLFDETAEAIASAVTRWAGVPVDEGDLPAPARDLVAMVDGFATGGPRFFRALAARRRRERWLARLIRDGGRRRGGGLADRPAGTLVQRLARLDHYLPPQDLTIDLSRIPAKPRSGVKIVVPQPALVRQSAQSISAER
jgi:fatty-acid peroxygenase